MNALKNDSVANTQGGLQRFIPYAAERLANAVGGHACLRACFGERIVLVPAPRSAPLVAGALWPSMQLCRALQENKLADAIAPLLRRKISVQKSATAARGHRPGPQEHYESIEIDQHVQRLGVSGDLVIVDDVITRGATALGCYARLCEVARDSRVLCFALVRTMSDGDIETIVAPIEGRVSTELGYLHREP